MWFIGSTSPLFTIHYICISSLVAWISDSQCQEKAKEEPKTVCLGIMVDMNTNPTGALEALTCLLPQCCGSGRGKVSCTLTLESVVLVLSSLQLRVQLQTDAA
jgi:hypothetical protein